MLDKKSAIYSERPILQMGGELLFHQFMGNVSSVSLFYPVEELETHRLLKRVAQSPDDIAAHIRKTAGAIILRISYGYEVKEKDDPFVTLADEALLQFSLATAPGSFLVDIFPLLKYLPAWFPGAGFKRTAVHWAQTVTSMVEAPLKFVKEQMVSCIMYSLAPLIRSSAPSSQASGTAEPSFTSRLLKEPHLTAEQE
ncbi:hypothetical protein BYT27DRAFT_6464003 [Phlegmacium glaucopus]|nr:hypothetical protein BYT27DRAFT_6464003 [Phlegmacium glaucopus]